MSPAWSAASRCTAPQNALWCVSNSELPSPCCRHPLISLTAAQATTACLSSMTLLLGMADMTICLLGVLGVCHAGTA
jgi:hypothetical protein